MIVKAFEINKKKFDKQNFFLIYGENEGLKKEVIQNLKKNMEGNIENYDEAQILVDKKLFYEKILNQSLFDKEKIIIVNRCSDKICEVIENIFEKNISDTKVILEANILDKKSKLRSLFEKDKRLITIPTYKDTSIGLLEIARKFFYNYKISISQLVLQKIEIGMIQNTHMKRTESTNINAGTYRSHFNRKTIIV